MWGSTFSDFAKKVEQQAASFTPPSASMFNLDSMQNEDQPQPKQRETTNTPNNSSRTATPAQPALHTQPSVKVPPTTGQSSTTIAPSTSRLKQPTTRPTTTTSSKKPQVAKKKSPPPGGGDFFSNDWGFTSSSAAEQQHVSEKVIVPEKKTTTPSKWEQLLLNTNPEKQQAPITNDQDDKMNPSAKLPNAGEDLSTPLKESSPTVNDDNDDEDELKEVSLLSPDITKAVTEASEKLSLEMEEQERFMMVSPNQSDTGSIAMELNKLAASEDSLRQELETKPSMVVESENNEEAKARKDEDEMEHKEPEDEETKQTDAVEFLSHNDNANETSKEDKTLQAEPSKVETTDNEGRDEFAEEATTTPTEEVEEEESTINDKEEPVSKQPVQEGETTEQEETSWVEEMGETEPRAQDVTENEAAAPSQEPIIRQDDDDDDQVEITNKDKQDCMVVSDNSFPPQTSAEYDDKRDGGNESEGVTENAQVVEADELPVKAPFAAATTPNKDEKRAPDSEKACEPTAEEETEDQLVEKEELESKDAQEKEETSQGAAENVMGMFSSQFQMLSPFSGDDSKTTPTTTTESTTTAPTTPAEPSVVGSRDGPSINDQSVVLPDDGVIEGFRLQIQRLEEHHAQKSKELELRHQTELEEASSQFEAQVQQVKDEYTAKLNESNEQIATLFQKNEGMTLKMDVLKRELDGTKALLEERETNLGKVNQTKNRDLQKLEKKLKEAEEVASASAAEVQRLKEALQASKAELDTSNDEFTKLKGRVKVVATELKERRVECRGLHATVAELKSTNESLQTQVQNTQNQLEQEIRSHSESKRSTARLEAKVREVESELTATEGKLKDRDAVGDKALAAYKKKAQTALAAANARAAAANSAREEVELETQSAKNSAQEALDSARLAEMRANETTERAEKTRKDFEDQHDGLLNEISKTKELLIASQSEVESTKQEVDKVDVEREKLQALVDSITHDYEGECAKTVELTHDLDEERAKVNSLRIESQLLREELQRQSVAGLNHDNVRAPELTGDEDRSADGSSPAVVPQSEANETILMLQQELNEANDAIYELRDALKGSLTNGTKSGDAMGQSTGGQPTGYSAEGNGSTPLFYAFEKQAELNTARNEIARLANLLGDAESARMEAYDAMDDMRRRMEEAEARLRRHDKLGAGSRTSSRSTASSSRLPVSSSRPGQSTQANGRSNEPNRNESDVNLEYLKNVMLSYLNAKTLAERKALVPVLAAVLELTPDEHAQALRTVEDSGDLTGVSSALLESLGSKVHQLM